MGTGARAVSRQGKHHTIRGTRKVLICNDSMKKYIRVRTHANEPVGQNIFIPLLLILHALLKMRIEVHGGKEGAGESVAEEEREKVGLCRDRCRRWRGR